MSATLFPTGTTTLDDVYCEWAWMDSMEMIDSEDFNGNLVEFVKESLEELNAWSGEDCEIIEEIPGGIHNLPYNAVVVGIKNRPLAIYFTEEVSS